MGVLSGNDAGFSAPVEAIAATTGTGESQWLINPEGKQMPFFCEALAGAEKVTVYGMKPDGTEMLLVGSGGSPIELNATNNAECLYIKGVYKFKKTATIGATGVYVYGTPFRKS